MKTIEQRKAEALEEFIKRDDGYDCLAEELCIEKAKQALAQHRKDKS